MISGFNARLLIISTSLVLTHEVIQPRLLLAAYRDELCLIEQYGTCTSYPKAILFEMINSTAFSHLLHYYIQFTYLNSHVVGKKDADKPL